MYRINHANIKEWAANYDGPLFDGILCDPPYELNFMNSTWDSTGIAFDADMWADILKLLKPGAHLLAFSGSRTYHRMAVAIEDAGFEIRDMMSYIYGSGFPKSLNIQKQMEKKVNERTKQNTEHKLRPMPDTDIPQTLSTGSEAELVLQPSVSQQGIHGTMQGQKPSQSTQTREEPSMERRSNTQKTKGELQRCPLCEMPTELLTDGTKRRIHNGTQVSNGSTLEQNANENRSGASHRPQSKQQSHIEFDAICNECITQTIRRLSGMGTALKPAVEPICLARKPLDGTVLENVLKHGTGGLNIDGTRVETSELAKDKGTKRPQSDDYVFKSFDDDTRPSGSGATSPLGRFPANLIHDGSDEVEAVFPQTKSGKAKLAGVGNGSSMFAGAGRTGFTIGDSGSASRFFFTAKPDLYCSLCYGIMEVCENNAQNAQTTSQLGTQASNTAQNNVVVRQAQEPKDKQPNKTNNAHNVVSSSASTSQTTESTAQPNVTQNLKELLDLAAKYAGIQCLKCQTSIAQRLVVMATENMESQVCQGFITDYKNSTQTENLVSTVAYLANIDITQTTINLTKLCGFAHLATGENTKQVNLENNKGIYRLKYQSKASKSERNAGLEGFEEKITNDGRKTDIDNAFQRGITERKNHHPTVKPLSLTKYLATLIKPPTGGRLLVPFSGSGSEMIGALQAGWEYVEGVELTEEYIPIAEARIDYWLEKQDKEQISLL